MDHITRPVGQKKRKFIADRFVAAMEEVSKLLKVDYIREVQYPEWLSNVVLVKNANDKWRICVEFIDLNKTYTKDSYPLPAIDKLFDASSGHNVLNFMDAFLDNDHIFVNPSDLKKTTFITEHDLYCYMIMPFGLNNDGAIYQMLVNKVFGSKMASWWKSMSTTC